MAAGKPLAVTRAAAGLLIADGNCGNPIACVQAYSPAVDMWSVGVILFILLSGYSPFGEVPAALGTALCSLWSALDSRPAARATSSEMPATQSPLQPAAVHAVVPAAGVLARRC